MSRFLRLLKRPLPTRDSSRGESLSPMVKDVTEAAMHPEHFCVGCGETMNLPWPLDVLYKDQQCPTCDSESYPQDIRLMWARRKREKQAQ